MPTPQDRGAAVRAKRAIQVPLALLIAIVAALVVAGGVASYKIYSLGNHRFVDQAGPFFAVTEDLAVEMLNEETGVRGYVITHDPSLLAPYYQGKKYTKLELALLAKDQGFAPTIPAHLRAMNAEVNQLQTYFAHEISLVRSGKGKQASANVVSGKGHFDHLRAASQALIADAGAVIKNSRTEQHSTLVTWWVVLGTAGGFAIAIGIGLLWRVPRRLYQLFREERVARREAEQAADASRALAHVREAVVLLDENDVPRYWNPSAAALFSLEPGDRGPTSLSSVLDQFHAAGEGAGAQPLTIEGRERWLVCAETEFDGGRVCVFRDVSDDHRLERLRSDFVATAAHELRTPLASVYGAVRTLRQSDHELPLDVREQFLEMIETESERLRVLMDQLLVSAQVESAELHLHRQPVDAVKLVQDLVDSTEMRKPDQIELALDMPAEGVSLDADPDRLRQVVANLVDNAIKYSPGGGRVSVRVFANGRSGMIEVTDQGLGIPTDEQHRIFEKFYRLDPSMTRGIGGSGLGLFISRELVQQMGGRLSVTSDHGSGSTFTISLPLVMPAPSAAWHVP